MSANLFAKFVSLLPSAPLQIGRVTAFDAGAATVQLPGGATVAARGLADVGDRVFVRDGVIEAPAPNLPIEVIEV